MSKTLTKSLATPKSDPESKPEVRSAVDEIIEKAKDFSERNEQNTDDELLADFQYD